MIPHFSDSERTAHLDMQKLRMDRLWLAGQIGTSTYLRSLFIIGYLPADANACLRELQEIKK